MSKNQSKVLSIRFSARVIAIRFFFIFYTESEKRIKATPPGSDGADVQSYFSCKTIPIEEARLSPLPTKFVKYDGEGTSRYAAKAKAVNPRCCLKNRLGKLLYFPDEYCFPD